MDATRAVIDRLGARRTRTSPPRLSVVVPVYNVERYLAECLDSILAQTFQDLEIVLVDDGSTDGSPAIAERYARDHAGIRLVRTANSGIGAARNTGVRQARGEFLAFVDSDDTIPPYAYDLLVSTLEQSGSDFAVGSLVRQTITDAAEPAALRRLHRERRLGINVDQFPQILRNVYAWNKVFRRTFWDSAGLEFPAGVRYEDQVTITEAYLKAAAFDVLRRPVYSWRVRNDELSITQRRHELSDLQDRLVTKKMTTEIVRRLGSPAVQEQWFRRGLVGDLPLYFRQLPRCDDRYWTTLSAGMGELLADTPPIEESELRVAQRLVGWLILQGRRSDAEAVLAFLDAHPRGVPLQVRGEHVVAQLPFLDDPGSAIPAELFQLREHELEWEARLQSADVSATTLAVTGFARVRGLPTVDPTYRIAARLCGPDGAVVEMSVEPRPTPQATAWAGRELQNYDRSGFEARLDMRELARRSAAISPACDWTVRLEVTLADIRREGGFTSRRRSVQLPRLLTPTGEVSAEFDVAAGLVLSVRTL